MTVLLLVFVLFGAAAMARLAYWQVIAAPELVERALGTMTAPDADAVARADITDRDGVVIAQSATYDRLDAYPRDIRDEDRAGVVETLAGILDLSAAERQAMLTRLSSDDSWTYLVRQLTPEQSVDVALAEDQGLLPGIDLTPVPMRVYPKNGGAPGTSLANQLVGFVAGSAGGGASGVEAAYDERLSGRETAPAKLASIGGMAAGPSTDADAALDLDLVEPDSLDPLPLTIDAGLQRQVEKELRLARAADGAKSVSAIVMDPYTGEILAMASVPGFDANDYAEVANSQPALLRVPNVADAYEPGSVMKIFTATAALDAGVVTPHTKIKDQVQLKFGPYIIRNADKKSMGWLPVRDVIARSRNVATAKMAAMLAPRSTQRAARVLWDLWARVGLTGTTGIDVSGELPGVFCDPATCPWMPVDLANRSFGQAVAVTQIQLATAFSTLVNGGFRVQPHVVADGEAAAVARERVLKAKVAAQARDILVRVTGSVWYYAKGSLIPHYLVGGKTGTAQIWDAERRQWKARRFNHSFVGFIGGDRPEYVIAVRIEEAKPVTLAPLDLEGRVLRALPLHRHGRQGAARYPQVQGSRGWPAHPRNQRIDRAHA